jgi:hypothetical protein
LTLNRAPFPLVKEVLTEESTFIKIIVKVQVGQGNNAQWEKCTVKIRKIDHLDKELMMNSIIEFEDTCAAGHLNLSTGEKLYSRFRELLGEVPRRLGQRPSGQGQFSCWVPQNPQLVHLLPLQQH